MEVPGGHANKKNVLLYECLGTAFLLVSINMSAHFGGSGSFQPIAVALTLYSLIMIYGPVSGAHFNPAVTVGVFVVNG